ncbi:EF-hand domain-containing protein [Teredinibacter franksiae]|jgi:hypothetical protein|uniref:EF-hand domain-containing protein n=1 Tax=Teredinibacter franksiae TaxID=2761453 RepID=UPI001C89C13D|nr:hypothetical protein [Teredinibacter franksiae]
MTGLNVFRGLAGAVLAGCILSGNVVAQPESSADDLWLLAKYDGNGDNLITVDEISDKRKQIYSRMDDNSDGGVSFEEYFKLDVAKREMLLKARFNKLDLDQDGNLSGDEYCSYLGSFERFDHNGDGNISTDEITSAPPEKKVNLSKELKSPEENVHCLFWVCIRTELD